MERVPEGYSLIPTRDLKNILKSQKEIQENIKYLVGMLPKYIPKEEKMLTVNEAAKIMRISNTHLYRKLKANKLPFANNGTGKWLIPQKALERFINNL